MTAQSGPGPGTADSRAGRFVNGLAPGRSTSIAQPTSSGSPSQRAHAVRAWIVRPSAGCSSWIAATGSAGGSDGGGTSGSGRPSRARDSVARGKAVKLKDARYPP
jgi:hypothetical protein